MLQRGPVGPKDDAASVSDVWRLRRKAQANGSPCPSQPHRCVAASTACKQRNVTVITSLTTQAFDLKTVAGKTTGTGICSYTFTNLYNIKNDKGSVRGGSHTGLGNVIFKKHRLLGF